ncbi:hypothetical protein NG796_16810 [Laspinema sp. A4]|uniref:hypothetical protein n=1 Tax=Laspinema sp. D2d TaxID=2953686 RepID=UPI0021BA8B99|nr:hypothetical protein [Laspinema sp. D2d]MCT7984934.1 hypothetical protein [Laspinema sp. D2d]
MARRLSGTVIINGTDDETWGSNEKVHRSHTVTMVLSENQPAVALDIPHVRWGGECRVEVGLTARVVGTGEVQIEGNAKLFEGTSENTDDLEDEKVVTFTVPKGGRPAHHGVNLRNTESGGGDHAEISFSFTNSIDE